MTEIICITDKHHPALPAIIQWLYDWWGKDEDYTKEQVKHTYATPYAKTAFHRYS